MASRLARGAAALAALVLLPYGALCGLMYAQQRDLTYFPQQTRVPPGETTLALARDGVTMRGWRYNEGRRDALIYFGGNAEAVQRMAPVLARWFPDRSVYTLAYRGYGASEGEPSEQALSGDALALFDFVAARHPDGDIAVMGRSLGTGVAAKVAAGRPVDRLVLVTPFDSLVGVAGWHYPWLPVDWLMRDRYESARHLAGFQGPVLILEAGRDEVVPAESTARLVRALPRPPAHLRADAATHDSALETPDEIRALADFLD